MSKFGSNNTLAKPELHRFPKITWSCINSVIISPQISLDLMDFSYRSCCLSFVTITLFKRELKRFLKSRDLIVITPSVAARLVSNESTSLDVPAIQFGGNKSYGIEDTKHFAIWLSEKKLNSLSRSTILDNPHQCFYEIWQQQNFATFFNPWKPLLTFGHK